MSHDANICAHDNSVNCTNCRLNSICMPIAISQQEVGRLEDIVSRGKPLQKGHFLYKQGHTFNSIYAVRSGALKTFSISASGEEHVMGFYLPGEIIGIDGLSQNHYSTSAIALDTSAVCEIPFDRLEKLSLELPSLQRYFFQLMSKEITDDQKLLSIVSRNSADQRLASLLLSLSTRHARRQLSATQFHLPMSRNDI